MALVSFEEKNRQAEIAKNLHNKGIKTIGGLGDGIPSANKLHCL